MNALYYNPLNQFINEHKTIHLVRMRGTSINMKKFPVSEITKVTLASI